LRPGHVCAATSIHLASSPDLEQVTGGYFANSKLKRSSKASYDETAGGKALAGKRRTCQPDRDCLNHHGTSPWERPMKLGCT
jgi:hypothetical protein